MFATDAGLTAAEDLLGLVIRPLLDVHRKRAHGCARGWMHLRKGDRCAAAGAPPVAAVVWWTQRLQLFGVPHLPQFESHCQYPICSILLPFSPP